MHYEAIEALKGLEATIEDFNFGPQQQAIKVTSKEQTPLGSVVYQEEPKWSFKMSDLPGCCGILVSFNTAIAATARGKGLGHALQVLKEHIARRLYYGLMLATIVASNEPEKRVLQDSGWGQIDEFINPKTGHKVLLFSKHL